MARMKDLLYDLENYEMLTPEEQKTIREMYNLTEESIQSIFKTKETITEIKEIMGEI